MKSCHQNSIFLKYLLAADLNLIWLHKSSKEISAEMLSMDSYVDVLNSYANGGGGGGAMS